MKLALKPGTFRNSTAILITSFIFGQNCLALPDVTQSESVQPAQDDQETTPIRVAQATPDEFSAKYARVTKKILQSAITLERLSLQYRLKSCKIPLFTKLVFFGTQEAGAASALAFEIEAVKQFGRGKRSLLSFNKEAMSRGLRTAEVGSIVAASGSGTALSANMLKYAIARSQGFDTRSMNREIKKQLNQIDALLDERAMLVDANPSHPTHRRAEVEGRIFRALRTAFVNEYAQFSTNTASSATTQNLFFALNASYNILGAIAAEVGEQSISTPKLNGPSNILFTISGAMAAASPLICATQLYVQRKIMLQSQLRKFSSKNDSRENLSELCAQLDQPIANEGSLIPSLPASRRLAMYTDSGHLFVKQLENEVDTMRKLNKVALQNSIAGPAIGGLLMTQGILGTRGYYHYFPRHPKKQFSLNYDGAICGTTAASMAVLGNAAWMVASFVYENRLRKQNRLPEQLIRQRLKHLDDLETTVNAINVE